MLQTTGGGAALATMGALAGCSGGGGGGGDEGGNGGGGGNDGGGGGSTSGSTDNVTLEIWLSYYTEGETKKKYTDKLVKQAENDLGMTINITGVPYTDVEKKFQSARAAGNTPDMVEVMTRPGILAGGAGLVVNDLWESSSLADKTSEKIMSGHEVWGAQSTGEKGNLVSMPLGFRPYLTCWRTDWLDQAGIDKTEVNHEAGSLHWKDDMPGIYQKLQQTDLGKQKNHWPDTTGMKQSDEEYMSLYIPQYGGSLSGVVDVTGSKATINSQAGLDAIGMQVDYIDKGYFSSRSINSGDEESTTMHWAGQIACNHIQDSTDLWGDYHEEQPQKTKNGLYTWGVPMNGGTKAALAWLPSLGFIKSSLGGNQAKQDAAMKFIEYWVGDPENSVNNAKNLGFVPVVPEDIQNKDYFGQTDIYKEFWRGAAAKTLNEFKPSVIPAVPGASAITYEIPRKMHQRILSNGVPVKEAADKAAEEINQVLQRNK
ncbi:MAG: extracellular solute-binding protein [Haloplanus sp.]